MAVRKQLLAVAGQSERTLLLGTILLALSVSAATGFVLAQYYSVDVLSSLYNAPQDCWLDWGTQFGRHCFSDYGMSVGPGMRPDPWEPYPMFLPWNNYQALMTDYPAAAMVPQLLFALPGAWLHAPRLAFLAYLLVLAIAVLSPAVWAARGARGLERVVVFVACGAAASPAWMVIDKANTVGLIAPIGVVFLVALCRQRWGLVATMVVLAALVKPTFAILVVALFAARQWRVGGLAVAGIVISNLAAFLLWPRDFPKTIVQWIHNVFNTGSFNLDVSWYNVSFGKGLLIVPNHIAGGLPDSFLGGPVRLIGYAILFLVVVSVLALGRRIPPVMVGIALLATASLFPANVVRYYLIFALPVAALVARNPNGPPGSGIFDWLAGLGDRRRVVGICVTLAAALSIAQIALPTHPAQAPIAGQHGVTGVVATTTVVNTTAGLAPFLWLIACAAIIVSYARRSAANHAAVTRLMS